MLEILGTLCLYRQHQNRFGTYELQELDIGPINCNTRLDLAEYAEMSL